MKDQVPLLAGVALVIALLYAAREFVVIREPVFGFVSLLAAVAVAVVIALRLRLASRINAGDK